MTNFEKYKDEILEVLKSTNKPAIINYTILCKGKYYNDRTTPNRLFAIEKVN